MNFVMIYGPPGVGKLTVAKELARLTGFKLFDNHMSIDWAGAIFDFGSPPFWRLVGAFRRAVIEEAAREGLDLIFTFVYSLEEDTPYLTERLAAVEDNGGRVCLVQLACEGGELMRRVEAADRADRGKLASAAGLEQMLQRYELSSAIPGRESLRVDNTDLAPEEAARRIAAHYGLETLDRQT